MKFLKALATPFVKIWNWIKQTAWVQPLLIVGCIFAVIFSIPYIASGIKNISKPEEDTMKYYNNHKLNMKSAYKKESEADKFLKAFASAQDEFTKKKSNPDLATANLDSFKKTYGEKLFFTFVSKECEACENFSKGFQYLDEHEKDFGLAKDSFKLKTIVVDEEIDESEKKQYEGTSLYRTVFDNNADAFQAIYVSGTKSPYYTSNLVDITDYTKRLENIMTSLSTIEVPLVVLIDTTEANESQYMASQVFYSINGDHDIDKAQYLSEAWNYTGKTFCKKAD